MFWKTQKVVEIKKELEILNNEISKYVCCFTGYRPDKLSWGYNEEDIRCIEMKQQLYFEIEKSINDGYKIFLCGMALGFDMICAETVLELKKKYNYIKLIGALPCKDQECRWQSSQQKRYNKILSQLDGIRCIYDTYVGPKCMLERNRYMINNSSKVIALYDGQPGGTQGTLKYAKSKDINIVILKP